jgi:hypothetical protein
MQLKNYNSYLKTLISNSLIFCEKLLCTCFCMRDGTAYSTAAQQSVCCLIWSRSVKRDILFQNRLTNHQCTLYLTGASKLLSVEFVFLYVYLVGNYLKSVLFS